MASPTVDLQNFAQSVYLVVKNRYFDDITSEDGNTFVLQIADFVNQFLDELENEVTASGEPVDWRFARTTGATLGTATTGVATIDFDTSQFLNLIAGENRYVQITQDGTVIANFAVVAPDEISNQSNLITEDMCAQIGSQIIFSRLFTAEENGGTITGDVTTPIPRIVASVSGTTLTCTNAKALSLVKPKQLLVLGVAKNTSLPDLVQGKLSPSYVQKYNDLLQNAIARNEVGGTSALVVQEDFGYIAGNYS